MKKAVIYARHSKVTGAEKLLEKQIEYCTYYAKKNGYDIVKVYSDLGLATEPRAGYDVLLTDAATADWNYVIVAACNRLTVTFNQFYNDLSVLRENDIQIVDIKDSCIINLSEAAKNLDANPIFKIQGDNRKEI